MLFSFWPTGPILGLGSLTPANAGRLWHKQKRFHWLFLRGTSEIWKRQKRLEASGLGLHASKEVGAIALEWKGDRRKGVGWQRHEGPYRPGMC